MLSNQDNSMRIAKNTIMLYSRMLLILGLSLYTARVVLIALGITDYGIYNVVAGLTSLFTFFTSSLSNTSQRFLSIALGKNDIKEFNNVFNISIVLYLIISIILLLSLETIGLWVLNNTLVIPFSRIVAANYVYQCVVATCFLSIMQVPFVSSIIAEERMDIYAYLGIFDVVAKLIIVLLLSYSSLDKLILYAWLLLFIQIVVNAVYVIFCIKTFEGCKLRCYWNKSLAKRMFSFISATAYGCFAWAVTYQGASILINIFFGPVVNAARGVAMQVNGALNNFNNGIVTAVKPQIIKSYASSNYKYMESLILFSSKYSLILMLLVAFPVIFNLDYLLSIWLKEVPEYTQSFIILIVIDTAIASLVQPIGIAVNATGKIKKMQVYGRTITLLAMPLSYILLKLNLILFPEIIFIAIIVTEIGYWLYCYFDMHSKIEISHKKYFVGIVIPIIILCLLEIPLPYIAKYISNNEFYKFIVISVSSILMLLVYTWYFISNKEEKKKIISFVKSRFKTKNQT